MDDRTWTVMSAFRDFLDEAVDAVRRQQQDTGLPALRDRVAEHLGTDPGALPGLRLDVGSHQFVNLDVAVEALVEEHGGGELVGVGGGDQRHHQTFGDMLAAGAWRLPVGPVDRARLATGTTTHRDAVAMGVRLFRYRGTPVATFQRQGRQRFGSETGLEVVAADDVAAAVLDDVRRLMLERSVFRGQVVGFGLSDELYGPSAGGITFLPRVELTQDDVVLPAGALARIERHVVGTARHRATLRAAGQHLKRGVLLFGPPGTGKTHTVRYLLGRMPGVTCVVLAGNALALVKDATDLAHALQPAVVVLEDVDLVAEQRDHHGGPQPLLFTLLDAMDGLNAEADVAFLLTTNRADLLEAALSQRPGRVDLAVEVPLPDAAARRALLGLYARGLPVSASALDEAAVRSGGVTASFFKELTRRTVLLAADAGREVDDAALAGALEEMLGDGERLTRALLGGDGSPG